MNKIDFSSDKINYTYSVAEKHQSINHIIHSHEDEYQLLVVFSGNLSYYIDECIYKIKDHCIIAVKPHQVHYPIFYDEDTPYCSAVFNFKTNLNIPTEFAEAIKKCQVFNFENNSVLPSIIETLNYYLQNYKKPLIDKVLMLKLTEIIYYVSASTSDASPSNTKIYDIFNEIMDYINQNRYTIKKIDEITSKFNITSNTLYSIFKKKLLVSPMNYIIDLRLRNTYELIKIGEKPYSIYYLCGFPDYPNYYRLYKKKYGESPKETYNKFNQLKSLPK